MRKRGARPLSGEKRKRGEATVRYDAVMAEVVRDMLADPNVRPTPDMWRTMLERFLGLLEREAARRPPHRPKSDSAGRLVTQLIEKGWSQAAARQRIAKFLHKSRDAVARAHNRYRREAGQK